MRVVEPKHFNHNKKTKTRRLSLKVLFLLIVVAFGLYFFIVGSSNDQPIPSTQINSTVDGVEQVSANQEDVNSLKKNQLRQFTDNEFKVFYDQLLQPNLQRVENPPEISGDVLADTRIRQIAEKRGYRLRSSPSVDLVSVDGYLLQEAVAKPWQDLKAAAAADGLQISILSGYRSVERQRTLFLSRLAATGATIPQVAAGQADDKVDEVLITSSIPGYSKHHTGYTFDLICAGFAFEDFKNSTCNTWISKDNYKVAKEHGFIPSYPPLADAQGPDPEAWEYVWVGTEILYE